MAISTRGWVWALLALGASFGAGLAIDALLTGDPVAAERTSAETPGPPELTPEFEAPVGAEAWLAPGPLASTCPAELRAANRKIEVLEARLALAETLERGYQGQLFGTPQDWPADSPEHLRPAGFQDLLSRSLDECQVPAELVDFECAEPPCVALLRPQRRDWIWSLIRDCPSWGEHFRRVPLWTDFQVDCGGGQSEQAVLLSPFWGDYPGDREDYAKRLASRWQEIRSQWRCGQGLVRP